MGQVSIEIHYKMQRSGKEKISLHIAGDLDDLQKIKLNETANTLGTHHMEGLSLVIDCEEQYDNHLAFETIIPQICSGLGYRTKSVDKGMQGRPAAGGAEYPVKLMPADGVNLSLYETSLIYKSTFEKTPTEAEFKTQAKEFMKLMKRYNYQFESQDKFGVSMGEDNGAPYLRAVLKITTKGKEAEFITDIQKKFGGK